MNKIVFFGTPAISVNALRSLNESDLFEVVAVVTNEDQFMGRSRSSKVPSAVKEYAIVLVPNTPPVMITSTLLAFVGKVVRVTGILPIPVEGTVASVGTAGEVSFEVVRK